MKLFDKINIGKIVKNHISTLRNANSKRVEFDDIFTFVLVPILISSLLIWFEVNLKNDIVNIIITTLSIFVGLMFNIIVLIFDIVNRETTRDEKIEILKQLLSNISFAILLSLLSIVIILFTYSPNCIIKVSFTFITYFLLVSFLFTLLMILKRMYNVFFNEMEEVNENKHKNRNP